jgi:hypothetical protein
VKFVYRDLRIENTACSVTEPRRWYLLDLECCAKGGALAPPWLQTSHTPGVLVEGRFTAASDLALLGGLLRGFDQYVTSAHGRAFLASICVPALQQQSTQELLAQPWICCPGLSCGDVGACYEER